MTSRLTFNYGLRYERINPFTEIEDRLNGFVPGVQSSVRPDAPWGWSFRATRASAGASPRASTRSCRASAWRGIRPATGVWSVRASYGLFYDQFQNGAGTASQVAISATPWAQFNQFSGAGLNFQNPYQGRAIPRPGDVRPPVHGVRARSGGQAASCRRTGTSASSARCSTRTSSKSATSARPASGSAAQRRSEPRRVRSRRDGAERRPAAHLRQLPGRRQRLRLLDGRDAAEHRAIELSRRAGERLAAVPRAVAFNVSYWFSKSLDHLSAMNLSGAAAKPLAGENDLAQNPFDLDAEYGSVAVRCPSPLRRERELGGPDG